MNWVVPAGLAEDGRLAQLQRQAGAEGGRQRARQAVLICCYGVAWPRGLDGHRALAQGQGTGG